MTVLTTEAMAQMVADREAGTPGPWFQTLKWEVGYRSDADDQSFGMICPIIDVFSDCKEADINRVQRLPDLEAAYLTLAAENATLRASEAAAVERVQAALEIAKMRHIPDQPSSFGGSELEWAQRQYASLRRDIIAALTPPKTEGETP